MEENNLFLQNIQFHVYSDEEVRNLAAVQITNCSTYDRRYPKSNGLNDIRMGVNDPHLVCPTCNQSTTCSNHYGFIELEKPIIRIGFINMILQILKCVCWACSTPKFYDSSLEEKSLDEKKKFVDIKTFRQVYINDSKELLKNISEACKKKTQCPLESCGVPQCNFFKHNKLFIRRSFSDKAFECFTNDEKELLKNDRMFPDDIMYILNNISNANYELLGLNPLQSHPKNFIMKALLVPPPNIRPANIAGDTQLRCENDLTLLYQNVIRANNELKEAMESFHKIKKIKNNNVDGYEYNLDVIDAWDKIQILSSAIINQNLKSIETFSGKPAYFQNNAPKRVMKDIKSRLCGKRGRLRANLSGKRVDHAARTVIGPDAIHDIFELGVPSKIMNTLTFPENVCNFNIDMLKKCILLGPNVDNGALSVKIENKTYYLQDLSMERKQSICLELKFGSCVERHLQNGNWVIFNRQPTLHKASIMAFKAYRVQGNQFKLSLACTKAFNADFDGDEMNLHALQDYGSIAEAQELMAVPHQIVTPQNNNVLIALVQDGLLGAYKLTKDTANCNKEKMIQMLTNIHYNPNDSDYCDIPVHTNNHYCVLPEFTKDIDLYDGKYILSYLFPKTFNFKDKDLEIKNGTFLKGRLSKKYIGTGGKIIRSIWQIYGPWACAKFISDLQRICVAWLEFDNECISIKDCLNTISNECNAIIESAYKKTKDLHDLKNGIMFSVREARQTKILQETRREIGSMILESMDKECGIANVVSSGSKGNEMNISQISGIVGQQIVGGNRIPFCNGPIGPRTLAAFSPYDNSPASRGFIKNSYIKGLDPHEFFYHQQAGREGVVATAVQTADAGYNQRRMIKNQESEVISYDKTVRGSNNKILQFTYNGDDFDGTRISKVYLNYEFDIWKREKNINKRLSKSITILKNVMEERNKYNLSNNDVEYYITMPSNLLEIMKLKSKQTKQLDINKIEKELCCVYKSMIYFHNELFIFENTSIDFLLSNLSSVKNEDPSFLSRLVIHVQCQNVFLTLQDFKDCLHQFLKEYKKGIVSYSEGVGAIGSSCIGEPSTQMTLNVFHHCGIAEKNVTLMGLPRFKQLIDAYDSYETSNVQIHLYDKIPVNVFIEMRLIDIIENCEVIKINENDQIFKAAKNTLSKAEILGRVNLLNFLNCQSLMDLKQEFYDAKNISEFKCSVILKKILKLYNIQIKSNIFKYSNFAFFYTVKKEELISKNIKFQTICDFILEFLGPFACVTHSIESDGDWIIFIRPLHFIDDDLIESQICEMLMHSIIDECIVNGIEGIKRCIKQNDLLFQTDGSNMIELIKNDSVNPYLTITNNVVEVCNILGVESSGLIMQEEFQRVLGFDGSYVDSRHTWLLTDTITNSGTINPLNRFKMGEMGGSILQRASFEQTLDVFESSAAFAGVDNLAGSTERTVVGQPVRVGTGCFSILYTSGNEEKENEKNISIKSLNNKILKFDEDDKLSEDDDDDLPFKEKLKRSRILIKDETYHNNLMLLFKELCTFALHKKTSRIYICEKNFFVDFTKIVNAWEMWKDQCISKKTYSKINYFSGNQKFKTYLEINNNDLKKEYLAIKYEALCDIDNFHFKLEQWQNSTEGSQEANVTSEKTCVIHERKYHFPDTFFTIVLQKKWKGKNYQDIENSKEFYCRMRICFDCPWEISKKFTIVSISNDIIQFYTFVKQFLM